MKKIVYNGPEFEKKTIGRGAAYIYIETIDSIISGYIFWIILSKLGTTEIIGISSTMVSFVSIVTVIEKIGIPTGVQRFIVRSFQRKKLMIQSISFSLLRLFLWQSHGVRLEQLTRINNGP